MGAAPLKRRITRRSRHREIKKKGFILSFGDIILPFVGVVAIGLLVVAGKLFFANGLAFSSGALPPQAEDLLAGTPPSADAEVPPMEEVPQAGLTAGTGAGSADGGAELSVSPKTPLPLDVTVIPYGGTTARSTPQPIPTTSSSVDAGTGMVKVDRTPVKPVKQKEAPPPQVQKKANAEPAKPPQPKPAPQQKPKPQPPAPQKPAQQGTAVWRVQVGAFSSKGMAQETVATLTKAGYRATVFSSPKFHKVWVQAGSTKRSAEVAILQLKKLGFPQSYAIPPAQR